MERNLERDLADTTLITYLFDPLCGWCYGASGAVDALAARPDFSVRLAPTGLFSGDGSRLMDANFAAFAWTNDQRISQLTGQPFSENYRNKVLGNRAGRFDSGPATLALTAVALTAPDREFQALKAVQKARYVEGHDITDFAVLSEILRMLNLSEAADRLTSLDLAASSDEVIVAYRKRIDTARAEMRRFGASGVPTLITGVGETRRMVAGTALFGDMETLIAELKAG